ncbi:hypothetical protein GO594_27435 [Pseudomonas otitidis]|uniref:Uncharacterized protein n=1 Tax=Metapseudomonas otitidis TaxID=319939 RepID=A0A7X3KWJ5_9GAMM|nr:hypothetical protein [Pseudomonas otitidis]MWK59736.1 hypothetical protein [Pseudomonas otitidis]
MTLINNNSPLAGYLASLAGNKAGNSGTSGTTDKPQTPSDPIADLRKLAANLVAQGRGGLMNTMAGDTGNVITNATQASQAGLNGSGGAKLQLPDVSSLDRDDAAKLLTQVQKLLDKNLGGGLSFVGVNGNQQTQSLETYRDWLQAKGGISVYA